MSCHNREVFIFQSGLAIAVRCSVPEKDRSMNVQSVDLDYDDIPLESIKTMSTRRC